MPADIETAHRLAATGQACDVPKNERWFVLPMKNNGKELFGSSGTAGRKNSVRGKNDLETSENSRALDRHGKLKRGLPEAPFSDPDAVRRFRSRTPRNAAASAPINAWQARPVWEPWLGP